MLGRIFCFAFLLVIGYCVSFCAYETWESWDLMNHSGEKEIAAMFCSRKDVIDAVGYDIKVKSLFEPTYPTSSLSEEAFQISGSKGTAEIHAQKRTWIFWGPAYVEARLITSGGISTDLN